MAKNKIVRHPAAEQIADMLLNNYDINSIQDVQFAIKDAFGPLFEKMLNAELDAHLGYGKSSQATKETDNRRNGCSTKTVRTSLGETTIRTPRDREGSFDPILIPKRQKDVTDIEGKVLSMYARGMSQRDISATIEDIYGFALSQDKISTITDSVLQDVQQWLDRPLKPLYTFVFVDCIYVKIKNEQGMASNHAVYVLLGIDLGGNKEILALHVSPSESKSTWMNILDNIKTRGVEDILFLSMDGISGLEESIKVVFPETVVQRCLVHIIRNSVKYIPSRNISEFCRDCKAMYSAINIEACEIAFDKLKDKWGSEYHGAIKIWENSFDHVRQLFKYPRDIRKLMYTTNAIESVNSSLRKVTKKGMFENPRAVLKVFYLRITRELDVKWGKHCVAGWAKILNQLSILEGTCDRIAKYMKDC